MPTSISDSHNPSIGETQRLTGTQSTSQNHALSHNTQTGTTLITHSNTNTESSSGHTINQDTIVKPKTPLFKPSSFSAKLGESISDFLDKYRIACQVNGWVGDIRKTVLPCYLEGVASEWYSYNIREHHSWDDVVTLITQAFQEDVEKRILLIKLKNRKFRPEEEPSMAYIQNVLTLCAKIDPGMASDRIKEFVLDGLPQDMLKSVMLRGDDTLVQVIDNIKKINGVNQMVDIRSTESELSHCNFIAHGKRPKQDDNKQDEILEKLKNLELKWSQRSPIQTRYREGGRSGDGRPTCYNCHKIGHLARFCRSRRNFSQGTRSGNGTVVPLEGVNGPRNSLNPRAIPWSAPNQQA